MSSHIAEVSRKKCNGGRGTGIGSKGTVSVGYGISLFDADRRAIELLTPGVEGLVDSTHTPVPESEVKRRGKRKRLERQPYSSKVEA